MNQSFYKILLLFMVSLAVGVLSGSGFFHLIPHSYELEGLANLWKSLVIVVGIYLFFFLEYLMKMIVRFKEKSVSENSPTWHHHNLSIHNMNDIPDAHNGSVEKSGPTECSEVAMKTSGKKKANPVAWMIIVGDGLHNFIDGLAIGASYSSSTYVGISTSLAIFCEELPHELGDFAILLSAGMSYKMAMGFNFLSACACYLGLVIGLILGTKPQAVMWIYPLAGGMFVYISLVDMLAEASEMSARLGQASIRKNLKTFALQNFGMLFGFLLMSLLGVYKKQISVN
ncbi:metal cation symporter ZIP14-like isoform X1 [Oculina patagonica]